MARVMLIRDGIVENIVEAESAAKIRALFPAHDVVDIDSDTHPAEPGAEVRVLTRHRGGLVARVETVRSTDGARRTTEHAEHDGGPRVR